MEIPMITTTTTTRTKSNDAYYPFHLIPDFRFSFLMTSFRPDQTSSTAQTLMSTSPSGSATSLMVSSVTSVGTFDDFLGHDTQIIPSGLIFSRQVRSALDSSSSFVENIWTISVWLVICGAICTPAGRGATSCR